MPKFDILLYVATITVAAILFAISLPLGSPHLFAYCLLSQIGTVAADDDAFRIFCMRPPTDSRTGVEGTVDNRSRAVKQYDNLDRLLPQSGANVDLWSEVHE